MFGKSNLIAKLAFLLFFLIVVNSQCCIEFTNGFCTKCPSGMHLYRNNCIYNVQGCQRYLNGFDCQICSAGYYITDKGTCEKLPTLTVSQLPTSGYSLIKNDTYSSNPGFRQLNSTVSSLISTQTTSWKYSYVFFIKNQNLQIYRCIIETNNGFIQMLLGGFSGQPLNLIQRTNYFLQSGEMKINFGNEPNYDKLSEEIKSKYSGLQLANIYQTYKSTNGNLIKYRIFYIDANTGITEIQIQISPSTLSTIQYINQRQVPVSELDKLNEFIVGNAVFRQKYKQLENAVAYSLFVRTTTIGKIIYAITYKISAANIYYLALYSYNQNQGNFEIISFSQTKTPPSIPAVNNMTDNTPPIPTNETVYSTFIPMSISEFAQDQNYNVIVAYIQKWRKEKVSNAQLRQVSFVMYNGPVYLLTYYTIIGGIYEIILRVNPANNIITFLSQEQTLPSSQTSTNSTNNSNATNNNMTTNTNNITKNNNISNNTPTFKATSLVTLDQSEYQNDDYYKEINKLINILYKELINNSTLESVGLQSTSSIRTYHLQYRSSEGTIIIIVEINIKGQIQVKKVQNIKNEISQTNTTTISYKPGILTKQQYENDSSVMSIIRQINQKYSMLVKDLNIQTVVYGPIGNKPIYTIVYSNNLFFTYTIDSSGVVTIMETNQKSYQQPKNQNSTTPTTTQNTTTTTATQNTTITTTTMIKDMNQKQVTQNQLSTDMGFKLLKAYLIDNGYSSENISFSKIIYSIKDGKHIYKVYYYYNNQKTMFLFQYDSATNDLIVLDASQEPIQSPVTISFNIKDGQTMRLNQSQYENDQGFLTVRNYLIKINVISINTDIFYATIKRIGDSFIYVIFFNQQGQIKQVATQISTTTGQTKVNQNIIKPTGILTAQQYSNDPTFNMIRQMIENQFPRAAGKSIQSVNYSYNSTGDIYNITYQINTQMIYFVYIVSFSGQVNILNNNYNILKPQPGNLTFEQYNKDQNVLLIKQNIQTKYSWVKQASLKTVSYQPNNDGDKYTLNYFIQEKDFYFVCRVISNKVQILQTNADSYQPPIQKITRQNFNTLTFTILAKEQWSQNNQLKIARTEVMKNSTLNFIMDTDLMSVRISQLSRGWVYILSYQTLSRKAEILVQLGANNQLINIVILSDATITQMPIQNPNLLDGQKLISQNVFKTQYLIAFKYAQQIVNNFYNGLTFKFIIYNSQLLYFKIFVSQYAYFKLQLISGNTNYKLTEVMDSAASNNFSITDASQLQKITTLINMNSTITRFSGVYTNLYQNKFILYTGIIVLQNQNEYSVLIAKEMASGVYRLFSLFSKQQPVENFKFIQQNQVSQEAQNFINTRYENVTYFSEGSEQSNSNIKRIIFRTSMDRCQIIFNMNNLNIFSIESLNAGFITQNPLPTDNIYAQGRDLLIKYFSISKYTIRLVQVRSWASSSQYLIIFESASTSFKTTLLYSNSRYYLGSNIILNSGIGKTTPILQIFSNSTQADVNKIKQTPQFIKCQNLLFTSYGYHLVQPTIESLYTQQDAASITYNIIYQTVGGTFLAVLGYEKATQIPKIKSLVLIDVNKIDVIIQGCQVTEKKLCVKCQEGYHLGQDGFCYKNIQNCTTYTGNTCLMCQQSFILNNNSCTNSCGPVCSINIYSLFGLKDPNCGVTQSNTCKSCKAGCNLMMGMCRCFA